MVYDVVPTIVVRVSGSSDSIPDVSNVWLEFPQRRDGKTPVFEPSNMRTGKDRGEFDYQIPFKEESILFAGDQYVDVHVRDRRGEELKQRVNFSIGARDAVQVYVPIKGWRLEQNELADDNESGGVFQLLALPPRFAYPPTKKPFQRVPLKPELNSKVRFRFQADHFFGKTPTKGPESVPRFYVEIVKISAVDLAASVGAGAAAVGLVFLGDEAFETIKEYFTNSLNKRVFKYTIPEIGEVELTEDEWGTVSSSHPELDKTIVTKAILALKIRDTKDFELWKNDGDSYSEKYLLLFKLDGLVYKIIIRRSKGREFPFVQMASGIFDRKAGTQTRDLTYQWSDVIGCIGEYTRDASPSWRVKYTSIRPSFPSCVIGEIEDDKLKTYLISGRTLGILGGHASARPERSIVETFPFTTEELIVSGRRALVPATKPDKTGELNTVGHSFGKHASNSRPGSPFPPQKGGYIKSNEIGESILRDILDDPKSILIKDVNIGLVPRYSIFKPVQKWGCEIVGEGAFSKFLDHEKVKPPLPL